jgi:hypothetical protein
MPYYVIQVYPTTIAMRFISVSGIKRNRNRKCHSYICLCISISPEMSALETDVSHHKWVIASGISFS